MARPRRGKALRRADDWLTAYLLHGEKPRGENSLEYFLIGKDEYRDEWLSGFDWYMLRWPHQGCRPWGWWKWSAPKLPLGTLRIFDGQLPIPRLQLSGDGCPAHEKYAHGPEQRFGIWSTWVLAEGEEPPTFETQFAYLERHGLLLPGEQAGDEREPRPYRYMRPL